MLKLFSINVVEIAMFRAVVFSLAAFASCQSASAGCLELVELGEPGFQVIEKCGEPIRREREERKRTSSVEVVAGNETTRQQPHQPLLLERWYYDTSINAATVIHLEDGGVIKKERLLRRAE